MEKYIRESDAVQTVMEKPDMTPDEKARIIRRLKAVPAADVVEVRHGQKIDITSADDFFPWCKCSVCGYDGLFLEDEYCSRCGAKLDGGQGG